MDMELSPEDSQRVREIKAALEAEFHADRESQRSTISEVEELKPDALATLRHIVKHSDNDNLKAKVSMWAIDTIIEAQKINDNPLADLVKGLEQVKSSTDAT